MTTDGSCLTEVRKMKIVLSVDLVCDFLQQGWENGGCRMGIAGWQILEKEAQILSCGCRDPVHFPIQNLTLYLNSNSLIQSMLRLLSGQGSQFRPYSWLLCKQAI